MCLENSSSDTMSAQFGGASGCSHRVSVNQLISIMNWLAVLEFLLPKPLYGTMPGTKGSSSINFLAAGM